ncbi:phosphoglycolate phosphatase [Catenovulum sp. 2E275]|uniref:phosphoglycolate phosphatase n=1 Tax=Catenovulum sp. 2E275 TaxID=2980497 RepID=UPI0021D0ED88|nr:phosphoglycolate phosphatase [Catenovulum sp. 2E275]MCU4675277.1 phosphoglycolate phosphatase [Catenovulum sp. 2E275]
MSQTQANVLLFDLDGTLIDSAPDLALAVNLTLAELGRTQFPEETIRGWVGNGAKVLIERALSGSQQISEHLDPAFAKQALAMFLNNYQNNICVKTKLYSGVKQSLAELKDSGYRLAIVTNKPEQFINPIIKGLGILDYFEVCVGGDTLANKKPLPDQLYYACEKMEVDISQCIMVGDSRNDILAAKAAGIASVGLTYGYNYGENIAEQNPEWVLDNFADLTNILTNLQTQPA